MYASTDEQSTCFLLYVNACDDCEPEHTIYVRISLQMSHRKQRYMELTLLTPLKASSDSLPHYVYAVLSNSYQSTDSIFNYRHVTVKSIALQCGIANPIT